jgi:hypothetical protein
MKKHLSLLSVSVCLAGAFLLGCGSTQTVAEKEQKALLIKEKVASCDFTFQASEANPMNFRQIHLTSDYDLRVSKDTVQAFLPYFGRAYVAPMDPSEGGFKFTSTRFEYSVAEGKRPGHWKVTIKTLDTFRQITLYLDIWENGTAQLNVNDPDRQAISFQGTILE